MKALRSRFVRPRKSLPPGLIFIIRNAAAAFIPTAIQYPSVDSGIRSLGQQLYNRKGSRRGHH